MLPCDSLNLFLSCDRICEDASVVMIGRLPKNRAAFVMPLLIRVVKSGYTVSYPYLAILGEFERGFFRGFVFFFGLEKYQQRNVGS